MGNLFIIMIYNVLFFVWFFVRNERLGYTLITIWLLT